jgi:hypothetical protein
MEGRTLKIKFLQQKSGENLFVNEIILLLQKI